MQDELGAVVAYMDILNSLDTTGIEPLSHVFDITNVMPGRSCGQVQYERGNFEKHAGDRGRYAGGAENNRLTSGKA